MIKSISPNYDFIGSFLAASPFLFDPEFTKSVIFITNYDNKGYTGFKVNHVLSPKSYHNIGSITPYNGGPVAKRNANILHTPDVKWEKTRDVNEHVCVTNIDKNTIDIEKDNMPEKYFLAFGFTSWSKGQLEEEIINGFWLPVHADHELIFTVPVVNRWYYAYQTTMTAPECVSMESARS